jgi:glutamate 5-kinase
MKKRYKRIVAKLGTNLITREDRLDLEAIGRIVAQVAQLRQQGVEVIVVSSGAVAAGRSRLGVTRRRRRDIPFRQVLAAVGQGQLMQAYDTLFAAHDIVVAQALLTRRDLSDRLSYLNARNTILALLDYKVVPIVNENDAVAVEELAESRIGENDTLSALTANLVDADLLVMLMTREGLYTADPSLDPNATLVPLVEEIDASVEAYAGKSETGGSGGMISKLQAARLATSTGTEVVIASGREPDVLPRLVAGEALGTRFPASVDRLESRKRWILSGLSIRGSLVVDDGAEKALRDRKTSLLPAGVKEVAGVFGRGETIDIVTMSGKRLGSGIANYSSEEMGSIKGKRSSEIVAVLGHDYGAEAVHRDHLVLVAT